MGEERAKYERSETRERKRGTGRINEVRERERSTTGNLRDEIGLHLLLNHHKSLIIIHYEC